MNIPIFVQTLLIKLWHKNISTFIGDKLNFLDFVFLQNPNILIRFILLISFIFSASQFSYFMNCF